MATVESKKTGDYVQLDGETYFRIENSRAMPEFFMSLVGSSDHWMFVSSSGAVTAGRRDPDAALFPYSADDQLTVSRQVSGPITLIRDSASRGLWEPFREEQPENVSRNLYKTPLGNKLVFEEFHQRLQISFRYRWTFSGRFGFVRTCHLKNHSEDSVDLELLDGLQNILPYGVSSDFMMRFSNLANAYKKNELLAEPQLGLYYLSSIPTDCAEPSEGLKTTVAWQSGLSPESVLLSTEQLRKFRSGSVLDSEYDVRGKTGAFLVQQPVHLPPGESLHWHIVADVEKDHAEVVELDELLTGSRELGSEISEDIAAGERALLRIASSADAIQCTSNSRRTNRHLANTIFNVMRGGIPVADYTIDVDDFREHVSKFNTRVAEGFSELLGALAPELTFDELQCELAKSRNADLIRLGMEYLPLAFSRRHGDPTRPWNRFAIELRTESGRTNLNYQGNWRDIFQNWEALAVSFPEFSTAMISRFVNATTADGYNPYRLTKDGFEWEEPTPDDPWANIGYWGDHQIIYLLKLLEWNQKIAPDALNALLDSKTFVHANVPYRIKPFEEIRQDPQSTILFDRELSDLIATRVEELGSDGKLLANQNGEIHRVSLLEKLLTLSLAKLSNFVPDGGIWLNTQRPEWNDANNALVGNGLSMVTACYLYRWFTFLEGLVEGLAQESFELTEDLHTFLLRVTEVLSGHVPEPTNRLSATDRAVVVEKLSGAGSAYRERIYGNQPSGNTQAVSRSECLRFIQAARQHLEVTIRNNRRQDGLYHSYNLLRLSDGGAVVEPLYEMLEGQVAVLSSGTLAAEESVALLDALRNSALYRENQDSYMLYPDRQLPRFMEKNQIPAQVVEGSQLLKTLLENSETTVVRKNIRGGFHFNGSFRNVSDLNTALDKLPSTYRDLVAAERSALTQAFEELFSHRQFTGRSGTFFAYEGLGSIYWHMVSKLGLAVAENFHAACDNEEAPETVSALKDHFQAVRLGVGAEKTPAEYGGFPTDPYSHTPENAGVKQPGMTGQVKEDFLSRFAELGVSYNAGCIDFRTDLLDLGELLEQEEHMEFFNLQGELDAVAVPAGAIAFTLCQVPVVYRAGSEDRVELLLSDGSAISAPGCQLDKDMTSKVFSRDGEILRIDCYFASLS